MALGRGNSEGAIPLLLRHFFGKKWLTTGDIQGLTNIVSAGPASPICQGYLTEIRKLPGGAYICMAYGLFAPLPSIGCLQLQIHQRTAAPQKCMPPGFVIDINFHKPEHS
jgi:hypothetical protein